MFTLRKKGHNEIVVTLDFTGTPRRIRTFDLRIRRAKKWIIINRCWVAPINIYSWNIK